MIHRTAAVIVTYNRCTMLEQCIEALRQQTATCDILITSNSLCREEGLNGRVYYNYHRMYHFLKVQLNRLNRLGVFFSIFSGIPLSSRGRIYPN